MTLKRSGFALIELLIVVSIVVLFSALSLAYYRSFDEQKKLDAEAKQLVDILNLAIKKSTAADLSPRTNCRDFLGYSVELSPPSSYKLQFNCVVGSLPIDIQSYTIRTGLTLSLYQNGQTVTGPFTVLFKPLSSGTNLNDTLETIIKNNTIDKCIKIGINPVGTVEELPNCP